MPAGSRLLSRSFGHTKQRIGLIYTATCDTFHRTELAFIERFSVKATLDYRRRISTPAMIKLSAASTNTQLRSSALVNLSSYRFWKLVIMNVSDFRRSKLSPVSIQTQSLALRALRALRKRKPQDRKRLRWQAANHGCHCFDRAFLLAGACVCCVIGCLPTQALAFLAVFVYATHATQAIAFEWKPGFNGE